MPWRRWLALPLTSAPACAPRRAAPPCPCRWLPPLSLSELCCCCRGRGKQAEGKQAEEAEEQGGASSSTSLGDKEVELKGESPRANGSS